jgi:hypothetical protein
MTQIGADGQKDKTPCSNRVVGLWSRFDYQALTLNLVHLWHLRIVELVLVGLRRSFGRAATAFPQEYDRGRTIPRAATGSMADGLAEHLCHKSLPCQLIPTGHLAFLTYR